MNAMLEPELAEHRKQVEMQTAEIAVLGERLSQEHVDWRPRPDKWSVGEHLAHLLLTNEPYLDAIAASVRAAKESGLTGSGPYRYSWAGNLFVRSMEPPPRLRMRTTRGLVPIPARPKADLIRAFSAVQDRLVQELEAADGVDLARATMRSPFLRMLKLSAGQAFSVLLAHNRRHLWHIRQILADPDFPQV